MNNGFDARKYSELAQSHYKKHQQLVNKLRKKKLRKLDELVQQWDAELFEEINCLDCANCCRSLGPRVTETDIKRISKHLKLSTTVFIDQYLRIDEDNDYVFQAMPCPFLLDDNYCVIYEKRPKACRDYPHTHQPGFQKKLKLSLKNTITCPVVYTVFQKLNDSFS
ncbi:MAG: YkgJ family cysteine cluster protein [Salinivirgaceae bacterium]|jgi:Fe-S-cluster containining protein|nr:YkgJ family cysteine cluster protein [Salinivirgaceae bacterium]